jgi:hypothetical protein
MRTKGLLVLAFLAGLVTLGCESEFYAFSNDTGKLYQWDPATNADTEVAISNLPAERTFSSLTISPSNMDVILGYQASDARLAAFALSALTYAAKGVCSGAGFPGMAYCKQDGKLYGIDPNLDKLFEITHVDTCAMTEIGPVGIDVGNVDLTCHPGTDVLYTYSNNQNALYTLNKATGAATLVGYSGIVTTVGGVGLVFDAQLHSPETEYRLYLYESDRSYQLNPATGAPTLIGDLANVGRLSIAARTVRN